jgi:threonine dehydrogenase-like Zn-dependent dehydrogenase
VRAYLEELLLEVLDGRLEPGKVFDRAVDLDGVPDGYRAMDNRESLKVLQRRRRSLVPGRPDPPRG